MLNNIHIRNYKMLDDLTIKDFAKINIFVGQNSCGKSSVLESIYLNHCGNNLLNIINNISNIRGMEQIKQESLHSYFHKLDETKNIVIKSDIGKINISSITGDIYLDNPKDLNTYMYCLPPREEVVGMKARISRNGKYKGISRFRYFNDNNSDLRIEFKNIKDSNAYDCMYINNNIVTFDKALKTYIGVMRYNCKENKFVKYLKLFDKNINDIECIGDDIYVCIDNLKKRVEYRTLGTGFVKYINILATLLYGGYEYGKKFIHKPYKVVCIDNIENGLHFTTAYKLMSSIVDIVKNQDTQLFITTHSYELVDILSVICNEVGFKDVNIYNIAKTKLKGMQSFKYSIENIDVFLENGTEFRN